MLVTDVSTQGSTFGSVNGVVSMPVNGAALLATWKGPTYLRFAVSFSNCSLAADVIDDSSLKLLVQAASSTTLTSSGSSYTTFLTDDITSTSTNTSTDLSLYIAALCPADAWGPQYADGRGMHLVLRNKGPACNSTTARWNVDQSINCPLTHGTIALIIVVCVVAFDLFVICTCYRKHMIRKQMAQELYDASLPDKPLNFEA